jgi:hypothetical protein
MGGSVSVNYIRTDNNNSSGLKKLLIGLSNNEVISLNLFEQIDKIPKSEYEGKNEFEIEYCIGTPYNSLAECANLFNMTESNYAKELDNYVITNEGSACTSLVFRPGSILYDTSSWLNGRTFTGNRCKIMYSGYPIYENDLQECCTGKRVIGCNDTLINNFETSHCNTTMQKYCAVNPSDIYCYRWLNTQSKNFDIALKLYSDLCSNDHTQEYCDYMCMYAREYGFSGYCDKSLENWCSKNINNRLCFCYITPSDIIPHVEDVLGPKECWLEPCTNSYINQKWLTTDQMNIKKNCGVQSCIITIESLIAKGNNKIDLINNCVENSNSQFFANSDIIQFENVKVEQTWGVLFDPVVLLISISLFILFLTYIITIKPIYTLNIND